jgi:hypothetical protein
MDTGCNRLATVARDIYSQFGWRSDRRLTGWFQAYTGLAVFLDGWFMYLPSLIREL